MTRPIEVSLVTSFACKACDKVKDRLHRLQAEFPELSVTELDVASKDGTAIALRYKLVGLPGILVNGRMALAGDVSEPLLRERLAQARRTHAEGD